MHMWAADVVALGNVAQRPSGAMIAFSGVGNPSDQATQGRGRICFRFKSPQLILLLPQVTGRSPGMIIANLRS